MLIENKKKTLSLLQRNQKSTFYNLCETGFLYYETFFRNTLKFLNMRIERKHDIYIKIVDYQNKKNSERILKSI